jgi:hypothetical protein
VFLKAYLATEPPTEDQLREARALAERVRQAERRGRRTRPTPLAYDRLARRRGGAGVAESLIARSNTRWRNLRQSHDFIAALTIPRFGRAVAIDHALHQFGLDPELPYVSDPGPGWLPMIRWGVDSVAQALRLLFSGQVLGAASLVRGQVERWTFNRANALGSPQEDGESNADFISRTWRGAWPIRMDPGWLYRVTSDALHGRGDFVPGIRWEACHLCVWPFPPEALPSVVGTSYFSDLVLQQCLAACLDLAHDHNASDLEALLLQWPPDIAPIHSRIAQEFYAQLFPLTLEALLPHRAIVPASASSAYYTLIADQLPADHSGRTGLVAMAWLSRRGRAVVGAIDAFGEEAKMLGQPGVDAAPLSRRLAHYTIVAETAALVARWIQSPHGDALAVGSTALRSAFTLWLEDDSRAMILARTALESAARARTWRLKPAKAARLELRGPRTSTSDWLAAAGWRRLHLMNRALGELAHIAPASRWGGALAALAEIADEPTTGLPRIHTARGDALDRSVYLLAIEACAASERFAPDFARATRRLIGLPADPDRDVERMLATMGQHGAFDFGPPMFAAFDEDERDAHWRELEASVAAALRKRATQKVRSPNEPPQD